MPTDNDTSALTSATLTVRNLPGPSMDMQSRSIELAEAAKAMTWMGIDEHGTLPSDEAFMRASLALIHMTEASEAMREASMLVSLLASSFTPAPNDSPMRAALLAHTLDDPSRWLTEAIATNRRLAGLPPQLDLVPDPDPS